jgi:hypothetical protein
VSIGSLGIADFPMCRLPMPIPDLPICRFADWVHVDRVQVALTTHEIVNRQSSIVNLPTFPIATWSAARQSSSDWVAESD